MIKIINGIYGCRGENGILVAKSPKDPPFTLSQAEETRLVNRGVAKFIGDNSIFFSKSNQALNSDAIKPVSALQYSINMSRKELNKIAETYGVSTVRLNNKAEVIAAIELALAEKEKTESDIVDDTDTDDEQPDLNIDNVVVEV